MRLLASVLLVCSLHATPVLINPDEPFGVLTDASFRIPENINQITPNPGDRWSNSVAEIFDREYVFTVTGGYGDALLKFRAYATTGVFFQDQGPEWVRRWARFSLPFWMETPGALPQGSVSQSCGETALQDQCFIPFTFGVPLVVHVYAESEASYEYGRTPMSGNRDALNAGILISASTELYFEGIYTEGGAGGVPVLIEGAQLSISSASSPEPAYAPLIAIAMAACWWRRKPIRHAAGAQQSAGARWGKR